ncbi:HTH-type transcriptional regulator DmlR [Polaromonas vacuolata]|uniref:HTH-type transcriptional regulator DmlR n=1 Tax=Polaromonas vacuolata TaxID=37448 RepID=A0A6H2H6Y5_9BURK|nr:LysR family transcriptional regulator [Polaromonas vacuolata]QJC55642.1 HTH-type transcriptional regulator DmlR [Polaromonas vacuolata]
MDKFNDLSIKTLRLFVAVLNHGSFSEVARQEGISPSSISRQIQQMEAALGQQLFYRHTRAVNATEAGRLLGFHARKVLAQLAEAGLALQEQANQPSGQIRINAPLAFGQLHIAPHLAELCQLYPQLSIDLQQTDSFVDPLLAAEDLLFRIGVLNDSGMQGRILAAQNYRLAASPTYLAKAGVPLTPEQLQQHQCLIFKGDHGPQRWFFRYPGQDWTAHALRGPLQGNNAKTLTQAALDGMGLVMFPTWLIAQALRDGSLVTVLPDYAVSNSLEQQQIAALYPGGRHLSLKVRAVIDFFVAKYGSPAYWDVGGF